MISILVKDARLVLVAENEGEACQCHEHLHTILNPVGSSLPELRVKQEQDQGHDGPSHVDKDDPIAQGPGDIAAKDEHDGFHERKEEALPEVQEVERPVIVLLYDILVLAVPNQKGCVLEEVQYDYDYKDGEQILLNDQLLIDVLLNQSDVLLPQEIDSHVLAQDPSAEVDTPFRPGHSFLSDKWTLLNAC